MKSDAYFYYGYGGKIKEFNTRIAPLKTDDHEAMQFDISGSVVLNQAFSNS